MTKSLTYPAALQFEFTVHKQTADCIRNASQLAPASAPHDEPLVSV